MPIIFMWIWVPQPRADNHVKIKQIHIFQHDLEVQNGPYTMANSTLWAMDTTLVKIIMENGIFGWGETCPLGSTYAESHAGGARAALALLGPGLIGQEIDDIATLHLAMDQILMGHNYAKAALDIAVYDCLGKAAGVPVAQLLGGVQNSLVPSYYALGINAPDESARLAKAKVDAGYKRLQVKVGGRDLAIDIEVMHKVHEAVGAGINLIADTNRGWSMDEAIAFSEACTHIPMIIEQPCNTIRELKSIRPQLKHKLYMDENAINLETTACALDEGYVDGFGMKLTRLGGLEPMMQFRNMAAARGIPHTCDDSWGGDIIAAACVHMGASTHPDQLQGVWIAAPYITNHYDPKNGIVVENGKIPLPSRPGLGILPDEILFGAALLQF